MITNATYSFVISGLWNFCAKLVGEKIVIASRVICIHVPVFIVSHQEDFAWVGVLLTLSFHHNVKISYLSFLYVFSQNIRLSLVRNTTALVTSQLNFFSTTPHHTTQHNTSHHITSHHITSQHHTTQHNTTQHNTTQHNTTSRHNTQCNTVRYNMAQHALQGTTQHDKPQHKLTL